jgi:hypothetical protein
VCLRGMLFAFVELLRGREATNTAMSVRPGRTIRRPRVEPDRHQLSTEALARTSVGTVIA